VRISKKPGWFAALLIIITAGILTNCKDDDNELGLEIQPTSDKLNIATTDTTSIIAYSQLVDSIKTDETSLSLLGSMVDPVFGLSTASFYTQVRLSSAAFSFGTTPLPDSLVLMLDYDSFYGDSTAPVTVRVYELDAQLLIDTTYYSNESKAVKSTLLAEKTFVPDFVDSIAVYDDTLAPHLRINLTDITVSLALKLLEAPTDSMETNSSFLNYFYGLYVEAVPANSGGQVIAFNLTSGLSKMVLFYNNATSDSLQFQYSINSNCARFGHFDHDYSLGSSDFKAQVIDKDTTLGKNILFEQALAGVKTFIRLPNITNYYANGSIAVNEARLFLSGAETEPVLTPATQLVLVKKTEDSYDYLTDQTIGATYFGGTYDEDNNGYWFRITQTVQDLMRSTDTDYGFELYISGGAINAQRVLLYGTDPAVPDTVDKKMKLVITYTKLN
jgi:hypothetical protein